MRWWWRQPNGAEDAAAAAVERVRAKYASFRELLTLNNESLELIAGLQDDLQFVSPLRDVVGGRIAAIFDRVDKVVQAFERQVGAHQATLLAGLQAERSEIERYTAALEELTHPRLAASLSELTAAAENEAGSKAAMLGEIRAALGLPVPDGFVLTTAAYRQYCGVPLWREIRDATRELDLNDLDAVRGAAELLARKVMDAALPRAIEAAIAGRAEVLLKHGGSLAVRSSARGEGGVRSHAGQFLSLLNVPAAQAADAYKRVTAGRFSERALFYRLSTGILEVDSPLAVLFLKMIPARAAGILYTRDPADSKSKTLWITATRGLGLEIASGRTPADFFVVSRSSPHAVIDRNIVHKEEQLVPQDGGGLAKVPLHAGDRAEPSLQERELRTLAEWGIQIEEHFQQPQDIEWVIDPGGGIWILQSRPLVRVSASPGKLHSRSKAAPQLSGGRTIYPGRTSGPAFVASESRDAATAPAGSVVFLRKPSPEIVGIFPRIAGLVAEWGNAAGHAAALLREFQIPSVFNMAGALERVVHGEPVSLDAVQARVYSGILWPPAAKDESGAGQKQEDATDPIRERLLRLHLLDPAARNFRPAGCKSAHDVLRYCHEKSIEAMFEVNDLELGQGLRNARKLKTSLPLHLSVLDLGGGVAAADPKAREVMPEQIVSRPFQALWQGVRHPNVRWTREMPAGMGDLASVLATAFAPQGSGMRALGERSYLLVTAEYMNLNSRLAYHYSLVDACICDTAELNYISFRFEGGGAGRSRRNLRACFLEQCLIHYGYSADRRGDLVNAWFRKASAKETAGRLDILGRLLACSNQLDMYMESRDAMRWFVEQFIAGNYAFQ